MSTLPDGPVLSHHPRWCAPSACRPLGAGEVHHRREVASLLNTVNGRSRAHFWLVRCDELDGEQWQVGVDELLIRDGDDEIAVDARALFRALAEAIGA